MKVYFRYHGPDDEKAHGFVPVKGVAGNALCRAITGSVQRLRNLRTPYSVNTTDCCAKCVEIYITMKQMDAGKREKP